MQLGALNNPHQNIYQEIRWIGQNNFDFLDLTIEPTRAYHLNLNKIKKLLKKYNLSLIGHTDPFLPLAYPLKNLTQACLQQFKYYLKIFQKLNIRYVNIHPCYPPYFKKEEDIPALIYYNLKFFKKINQLCQKNKQILMLENFLSPFDTPPTFQLIKKEIPPLKIHLDIGHANLNQKQNLTPQFFRKFKKDIIHIHFSDNHSLEDEHLPLGAGNIDWLKIIKTLKRYRYNNTITLEVFSPDRGLLLYSKNKVQLLWQKIK